MSLHSIATEKSFALDLTESEKEMIAHVVHQFKAQFRIFAEVLEYREPEYGYTAEENITEWTNWDEVSDWMITYHSASAREHGDVFTPSMVTVIR